MKKKNLKSLLLNKKAVSNLTPHAIKGGDDTVAPLRCTDYFTDVACSLQGGCGTTGPRPSGSPACNDK